MANDSKTTLVILQDRKARLVSELMKIDADLTRELLITMESIHGIEGAYRSPSPGEFAGYADPLDAAEAYLKKVGIPKSQVDIINATVSGGWGRDEEDPHVTMRAALYYNINISKRKRFLKFSKKLVGLPEWKEGNVVEFPGHENDGTEAD